MTIIKDQFQIRPMKISDIERVVSLYSLYMGESTFSLLGKNFLKDLFHVMLNLTYCSNYVCETNSDVVAFISVTENSRMLFKDVLKNKIVSILLKIIILGFKAPLKMIELLKTPFYFNKTSIDLIDAEMLFITVLPEFANKGVATKLVDTVLNKFIEKGIKTVKVSVVKNNQKVNNLLLQFSFKKHSDFKFLGYERCLYIKTM